MLTTLDCIIENKLQSIIFILDLNIEKPPLQLMFIFYTKIPDVHELGPEKVLGSHQRPLQILGKLKKISMQ